LGVVREARDRAVDLIRKNIGAGKPLQGWQVDKAARGVIEKAGYGNISFTAPVTASERKYTATAANMTDLKRTTCGT